MSRYDAFVLAAGFGTRLRPLTLSRPKPLVPVCGVPLLAYSLALCARHGLSRVVVNAHHLAPQIAAWAGEREGVAVAISLETPEILGTGGGLKQVEDRLAERFVVVNADVLCDVDLGALLAAVPEGGAAMALRRQAPGEDYGVVAADASGRVVRLVDVAAAEAEGAVLADTHFTGIHALDRRALALVPDGFQCIVRTAYRALVPARKVAGLRHDGLWLDLGNPVAYLDANLAVLRGDARPALDPLARAGWARRGGEARGDRALAEPARVEGDAWIGEGARIARDVTITRSIVGHGAQLAAGVHLVDSVVWDGVQVPAGRYDRAIVHDQGVLHVR